MRLKRIAKFTASVTKGLLPTQQATLTQMVCGVLFCRSLILAEIARGFETGSGANFQKRPSDFYSRRTLCS
jgi:hypothetical protein